MSETRYKRRDRINVLSWADEKSRAFSRFSVQLCFTLFFILSVDINLKCLIYTNHAVHGTISTESKSDPKRFQTPIVGVRNHSQHHGSSAKPHSGTSLRAAGNRPQSGQRNQNSEEVGTTKSGGKTSDQEAEDLRLLQAQEREEQRLDEERRAEMEL